MNKLLGDETGVVATELAGEVAERASKSKTLSLSDLSSTSGERFEQGTTAATGIVRLAAYQNRKE